MRDDMRVKKVFKKYGLEGFGLYVLIMELIASDMTSNDPDPVLEATAEDIAMFFGSNLTMVEEMMSYMISLSLFIFDHDSKKIVWNDIYHHIDKSQTRSMEIRNMIDNYKANLNKRKALSETVSDSNGQIETEPDISAYYQQIISKLQNKSDIKY